MSYAAFDEKIQNAKAKVKTYFRSTEDEHIELHIQKIANLGLTNEFDEHTLASVLFLMEQARREGFNKGLTTN